MHAPSRTDIDHVFHALGDANRRTIIDQLSRGPMSVSTLAEPLTISLAAVVQHLQILEDAGIVVSEKQGRVRTCRLEPGALSAAEHWLHKRRNSWQKRFDRLGSLLANPES